MQSDAEAQSFWEHIVELSRRMRIVFYSLIGWTIFFLAFPGNLNFLSNPLGLYEPIVATILRQIRHDILPTSVKLIGLELTAPLELYFVSSVIFAFAATIPILAYQVYKFVDPALYPHERSMVYPFVISFSSLFTIGVAFGYLVLAPFMIFAMIPFFGFIGAEPTITVTDFYNMVFVSTVMTGTVFTFPIFFVLLVRFGVLSTKVITTRRRYVYAALYIIVALVTPDGGPIADVALFVPMAMLLEIAVFFAKRYERDRPSVPKPEEHLCPYCGQDLRGRKVFCPNCNKSLS